jgi:hypothetical protein
MLRTRTAMKLSSLSSTSKAAIGTRRSVSSICLPAVEQRRRGQVVIVFLPHRVMLIERNRLSLKGL